MEATITTGILLSMFTSLVYADVKSTVVFSPSELEINSKLYNNSIKLALRYGFQQTSECNDFPKAYICIQKCLDLGFDTAYSDRYCFCTCYHKKGKAKHTTRATATKTKWKLGAPKTKLPAWASTAKNHTEVEYILVDGNATVPTNDNSTSDGGTHVTDNSTGVTPKGDSNSTATAIDGETGTGGTGGAHNGTTVPGGTNNPPGSDGANTGGGGADTGGTKNPGSNPPNSTPGGTEKPAAST
ncbi:uncharacterized protein LOC116779793 [Danaus plexippus]|uniref:uncharacterized protein LOC116779793 n=1 Tax=Danaus plexippus TaxID=13037 RepID=UPI002AB0D398|nr:uncharacterized protein LOC116779793 [Danaus plexippus]